MTWKRIEEEEEEEEASYWCAFDQSTGETSAAAVVGLT
jgi:hypothetical protein